MMFFRKRNQKGVAGLSHDERAEDTPVLQSGSRYTDTSNRRVATTDGWGTIIDYNKAQVYVRLDNGNFCVLNERDLEKDDALYSVVRVDE